MANSFGLRLLGSVLVERDGEPLEGFKSRKALVLLGYLASQIEGNEALVQSCRKRLTQGNSKLDPALPCPRLVKAWRLWIPKSWEVAKRD